MKENLKPSGFENNPRSENIRESVHLLSDPVDWSKLIDMRVRATRENPEVVGVSVEDVLARTEEDWKKWFSKRKIYIIENDNRYVSTATLIRKGENGASIHGVWTDPEFRKRGYSKKVLSRLIEDAKSSRIKTLSLHVLVKSDAAKHVYELLGFKVVGYEKDILMGDGKLYDQEKMELDM